MMSTEAIATTEMPDYALRISRLTIDKLGVRLYDKVSAVVAELVANGYDADATEVHVEVPLGTELARKHKDAEGNVEIEEHGFKIVVRDNGHGMTPIEAKELFLNVGDDRRRRPVGGARTRTRNRPVMGRKGIGKLAPFGICRTIEIISSGGENVEGKGYLTAHFVMEFERLLSDREEDIPLKRGDFDGNYRPASGTSVILYDFLPKRVPDSETFQRQLATRFALADESLQIIIRDTRADPETEIAVKQFDIPVDEVTRVDLAETPVECEGEKMPVTGWLAFAKSSYKNEELAGVRIYARGKIVATTRDFEQPAGFTGEFTMRSYLVGVVHADWLDSDDDDDLIRTDRQSILWDSEKGSALRAWGADLIKKLARASTGPRRKRKSAEFLSRSNFKERAEKRYGDQAVVDVAMQLAEQIGAFAAEDELADDEYVDGLAEFIFAVAPQYALVSAFLEISRSTDAGVEDMLELFHKTRTAEFASYGLLADQRVRSVLKLGEFIGRDDVTEGDLQNLIAEAPWLIATDWSVITQNQTLRTFRDRFVEFYEKKHGTRLDIAISYETKKPDFTAVQHGRKLRIVELKKPGHAFDVADYDRLQNYVVALQEFFAVNKELEQEFPDGWHIDLIADSVRLGDDTRRIAFDSFMKNEIVVRTNWNDFLTRAEQAHSSFLDVYHAAKSVAEKHTG